MPARWLVVPGPADAKAISPRLREPDEVGGRTDVGQCLRTHRKDEADGGEARDGLEILERIKGLLIVEVGIDAHDAVRDVADRGAVGTGLRDLGRADVAASARAVENHDLFVKGFGEGKGDGARENVAAATGREGHDHRDRGLLRKEGAGCGTRGEKCTGELKKPASVHDLLR